ncbi:DUF3828 domain-containing protein [Chryseobacterium phosphatilyticum]|uniref:DUF3828 domain-containing protein n=2 Tax=Chryseobacterium phosphatilyticum TaxID=475075 RepID=A0A316XEP7_9FLAO|nr:DUF3828 domain-containing protein [Chryseobacterium phosphatilyticum]
MKIIMKNFFLYLSIFFAFISCNKKGESTSSPVDSTAVKTKISALYDQYGKSNEMVYNQPISSDLFSPDLKKNIEKAIQISKEDIEKVKKSAHPDEKPLIFEGAIFSSLYEGFTDYKIQSMDIHDTTADVIVQFEYNMATPKVVWTDKVHLINSDGQWKIDNIDFDTIGNSKNLTTRLNDFIHNTP